MISHGLFNSGSSTCLAWFAILWSCTPVASLPVGFEIGIGMVQKAMIFWRIFVKSGICHWHLLSVQLKCYLQLMRCVQQTTSNIQSNFDIQAMQFSSIIENVELNYLHSIFWANICWLVRLCLFNWKSCKINKSLTNSGPSDNVTNKLAKYCAYLHIKQIKSATLWMIYCEILRIKMP